jgi:hypothetical protein
MVSFTKATKEAIMGKGRRAAATAVMSLCPLLGVASGAWAGPTNNEAALEFTATCGGEAVDFVVIGGGYAPALVVGEHELFVPQAFDLTSTFTLHGGSSQVSLDQRTKQNVSADAVACTLSNQTISLPAKGNFPGATLVLDGTVVGVFRGQGTQG